MALHLRQTAYCRYGEPIVRNGRGIGLPANGIAVYNTVYYRLGNIDTVHPLETLLRDVRTKDDRIHAAVSQLLVAVAAKRLTRPMEEPQIAMQPGHVSFGTVAHHVVKQQGIAFQKRDDRVVTPPYFPAGP